MNSALTQAFLKNAVTVRKTSTGQVCINFKPGANHEPIYINNLTPVNLTQIATVAQLKLSNLDSLVGKHLRIV